MKRKNLVAMGLAGVMAVGMCMPVMAADITPSDTEKGTPSVSTTDTSVTAVKDVAYKLTIPGTVKYNTDGSETNLTLSVETAEGSLLLHEDGKIAVSVTNGEIVLKNNLFDGKTVGNSEYKVQLGTSADSLIGTGGGTVAEFTNTSNSDVNLVVKEASNQKFTAAGHYTGSVTFNIEYAGKQQSN